MKKINITVVHLMDLVSYPPVLSLIQILLKRGYSVNLISIGVKNAPNTILEHPNFKYTDISIKNGKGVMSKLKREIYRRNIARKATIEYMKNSDFLWTTTDISVRCLGKLCLKYKHIMQLMELEKWYPYVIGLNYPRFPLYKYSQAAWKNVVPEVNRAHIQKIWWNLQETPIVLPNKPYNYKIVERNIKNNQVFESMKKENRKVVLYLGIIAPDRNIELFAETISKIDNQYCLYIAGRVDNSMKKEFDLLLDKFKCVQYLGNFKAPQHLELLEYADIGLTPYYITKKHQFISPLNIEYCAPNKIFEYAAYGIPMIGTDVMGLRQPFEKYNIGICCENFSIDEILSALKTIDKNYMEMKQNCYTFFNSVNLEQIIEKIILN